ncbi:small heat shock protein [Ephemerocybe angulata]|uniref:Small heat shock protein n=1 Tax=Ephemerocybe angulata TaxID=980116 RepID=A0A8H6HSY9_9AGAR|nr:small heat shock protein [Tulosesus angulatus]
MSNVFFYEPFYDMDRFLDEAFGSGRRPVSGNNGSQLQRRGASDSGDGAIRNLKPRKISTSTCVNGRLTVSAESKGGYAVRERRFGKFSRTLQLPQGLKEEIKASMENGVLTVTFPKSAPELAPKKISVS